MSSRWPEKDFYEKPGKLIPEPTNTCQNPNWGPFINLLTGRRRKRKKPTPRETRRYAQMRKEFLAKNPWCAVALLRGEQIPSTVVHHRKGRADHFLDLSTFVAVSKEGDRWIHANESEARKLGLLA